MNDEPHWRDSSRQTRFFFVDALAALPVFLTLLHIKLWTFLTTMLIMVIFGILERFKFTVPVFFRWLKCFIGGNVKLARPWWRE